MSEGQRPVRVAYFKHRYSGSPHPIKVIWKEIPARALCRPE